MAWVEQFVFGVIGGAVGMMALFLMGRDGAVLDLLSAGLQNYLGSVGLIFLAAGAGVVGGRLSESTYGAGLGGFGVVLAYAVVAFFL